MTIKRSLSATPTPSSPNSQHEGEDELDGDIDIDIKPDLSDIDNSTKRPKATKTPRKRNTPDDSSATPSPKKRKSTSPPQNVDWKRVEGWTPEKREAFMIRVIGAGMTAAGTQNLADEFGMTKMQINNAISAGKKNNFREKAIKAVRGE